MDLKEIKDLLLTRPKIVGEKLTKGQIGLTEAIRELTEVKECLNDLEELISDIDYSASKQDEQQ